MHKKAKRKGVDNKEKTSSINHSQIKKAIKKEEKIQAGLSCCKINFFLKNIANFYGCFSYDELQSILIDSLPIKIIVNLDNSSGEGSHWLAIRIDKRQVEIFDPLGFNFDRWPHVPFLLISFIKKISFRRRLLISREIQSPNSFLCGFYCIYYFLARENLPFNSIVNTFSTHLVKNDRILKNLLYKIK